jgi:hypothetical protein
MYYESNIEIDRLAFTVQRKIFVNFAYRTKYENFYHANLIVHYQGLDWTEL